MFGQTWECVCGGGVGRGGGSTHAMEGRWRGFKGVVILLTEIQGVVARKGLGPNEIYLGMNDTLCVRASVCMCVCVHAGMHASLSASLYVCVYLNDAHSDTPLPSACVWIRVWATTPSDTHTHVQKYKPQT